MSDDVRDMFPKQEPFMPDSDFDRWIERNYMNNGINDGLVKETLLSLYHFMVDKYEEEMWERQKEMFNEYEDKLVAAEDKIDSLEYQLGYREWEWHS